MYIEDALGDRVWVDLESCKDLIANMCTLFATKQCSPLVSGSAGKGAAGSGEQGSSKGGGEQLPVVSGSKGGSSGKQGKNATGGDGGELDAGEPSKEGFLSGIQTAPRYTFRRRST